MGWEGEPEDVGALAADFLTDPDLVAMAPDFLSLDAADRAMVMNLVTSLAAKTKKD